MKKMVIYFNCVLLCAMIMNVDVLAQDQNLPPDRPLSDKGMSERLAKDLNSRNAITMSQPISWWSTDYGFYGTYMVDSMDYLTRYDKQGKYLETLTRKVWNNSVPVPVANAFNQSQFKNVPVIEYWEVTDPNRKGYLLKLNDNGKEQRLWINDQGKLSTKPYAIPGIKPNNP